MSNYDFAVDVFSFGCVLFEIMAQKELYDDLQTAKQVQDFVLAGNREQIPEQIIKILRIPTSYLELTRNCMAHNPLERPHFKDIISRLEQIAKLVNGN